MRISDWSSDVCSSDLSFAADHMGLSSWRGKFNRITGSVTLDPEAGTGTVEVKIDLASIDFGHDKLNHWATGEQFFDVANYPEATFTGRLVDFTKGAPTRAETTLSLPGVTRPPVMRIQRSPCIPPPMPARPRSVHTPRATGEQFFDVAKYPEAPFTGRLVDFTKGAPTRAEGTLSLHGVTRPLVLRIDRFKCIPDPMLGRPRCGADARATFKRDTFGLDAGKDYGFDMTVELRIQIEALENP